MRESILVLSLDNGCRGSANEKITVERVATVARIDAGLYLMVPVNSEIEADELSKRLHSKST